MSKPKNRPATGSTQPGPASAASAKSPAPPPRPASKSAPIRVEVSPQGPVTPMFRAIDWWVFVLASFTVMVGYLWTLAPNQTLEDSGELATASMYAGIPHPPGYPVWTLYTWFFTKILPFGNIAWRVGVASAFAGALSCGIIGMMVSRGSSMLIESVEELKAIDRKIENWLCLAAGLMGGLLMGFNGYFWSQAVIVEVYTLSVLSLVVVMVFLLRWLHAPHQYRYLYAAMFVFGICFTNHQTLIVAAIGIEVLVAAAQPRLGRDLFLGNSLVYLAAVMLKLNGKLTMFDGNPPLFVIFNVVGIFSLITCLWLVFRTRGIFTETLPAVIMGLLWVAGAAFYFYMPLAGMSTPPLNWGYPRTVEGFWHALQRGQYEKANPANIIDEPDRFAGQIWQYIIGCVDEFNLVFLALALIPFVVLAVNLRRDGGGKDLRWLGLLNSGIVLLFLLAASLNIYGKSGGWEAKGLVHLVWYGIGALVVVDLLVLIHVMIRFLQRKERAWMFGLGAIYLGLALLLLVLLNPAPDRQSKELNRVFFTSSHVMIAMWSGYGLALLGALLATNYQRFRRPMMWFAGASSAVALYSVAVVFSTSPSWREVDPNSGGFFYAITRWFDLTPFQDPLSRGTALFGLALAVIPLVVLFICRERAPMKLMLGLFLLLPAKSVLSHWWENEQRGHLYGYWFGHDMFTPPFKDKEGKPLYPEMDRDTVLYGGTDPGRFNPTYMIYCESFIPARARQSEDPNFDRRDVYLITQNALADATYLNYIRAHYNRSAQKDPPFFTEFFKTDLVKPLDTLFLGTGDRIETTRRAGASLFQPADFKDLAGLVERLKPGPQQDPLSRYLRDHVKPATRELLDKGTASPALASALARDFNELLKSEFEARRKLQEPLDRLGQQMRVAQERAARNEITATQRDAQMQDLQRQANELFAQYRSNAEWLYHPSNFNHLQLTPRLSRFIAQDLNTASRMRMGRQILEANYGPLLAVSEGGVYPDLEINTATPEDSQQAFTEYIQDAQKRLDHDRRLPNEPKQIKPGEDVRIDNGRVQVSGQIAVMSINGLLTKVMFDKNPNHEFYVEESFPLDWMYPHLTPFGIIMKINRQPLVELSDDVIQRDKEFWSQYDERLIGRWIKDDTSVKDICDFAERVYLRRDLRGYTGSTAFVRDDNAQKAFSKLRSAIGGVFAWRINNAKSDAERRRMIAAADFTFRQAFAYCPYSPEATFRYINLLVPLGRIDDAILIANTCKKLDPENGAVASLVQQLASMKGGASGAAQKAPQSTDVAAVFGQVQQLVNQNRRPEALALLDQLVVSPAADATVVMNIAQAYLQLQEMPRLEGAMKRMVTLMGDSPEANYDLAAIQAVINKPDDSMSNLAKAIQLGTDRVAKTPGSRDLLGMARTDARFQVLRARPDFQKLVPDYAPPVPNQAPPAAPQLPPGTPSIAIPALPAATNK